MKNAIFSMILALASGSALADQCQVVSRAQAEQAIKILNAASRIEHFCRKCGELGPTPVQPYAIDLQTFGGLSSGRFSVAINGKAIDLAYTYANDLNVAMMVGCETHGVTPRLRY